MKTIIEIHHPDDTHIVSVQYGDAGPYLTATRNFRLLPEPQPMALYEASRDVFESWNKHGANSRAFDDAMDALARLLRTPPTESRPQGDAQKAPDAWLVRLRKGGHRSEYATIDQNDSSHEASPYAPWDSVERLPLVLATTAAHGARGKVAESRLQDEQAAAVFDLWHVAMGKLISAVTESDWIPAEYCFDDWISDCCEFLKSRNVTQTRGVPDGWKLVPQEIHLDRDAVEIILFHMGGVDENSDDPDEKYSDGRLYIGNVKDDDGKEIHGLHILTDEYPEEGCSLLVEFPDPLNAAPSARQEE